MGKRVFISYRHVDPDEGIAQALHKTLARAGHQVFIDKRMSVGTEWAKEIDRELRRAEFFIVLLSAQSILSDMVRQEIALAHELRISGQLRILPMRIAFMGALPYDLGSYLNTLQYASWKEGESPSAIIDEVRAAIEAAATLSHSGVGETAQASESQLRSLHEATEKTGAPLPAVDPRLERGAMQLDSPFYVRRMSDDDLEREIKSARGTTAIVKGARQMGKSSLLARIHAFAGDHQQRAAYIDFQLIDQRKLQELDSLLKYLAARLARDLKTPGKPGDYWDDLLGAKDSITEFVEKAILADAATQVTLLFDEADRIFEYGYRDDFFSTLRAWTNRRATHQCGPSSISSSHTRQNRLYGSKTSISRRSTWVFRST